MTSTADTDHSATEAPDAPTLSGRQEATLAALRDGARPTFDRDLAGRLRGDLHDSLTPAVNVLRDHDDELFLSKHALSTIHACEASHVAEADAGFAWSLPTVRGTVAHKAVELGNHALGDDGVPPPPAVLVDWALSTLVDEGGPGGIDEFLTSLDPHLEAQLRSEVTGIVSAWSDGFPPLPSSWRPVFEARVRHDVGGRIKLSGKTDLALGRARGDVAGRVIVDVKTGGRWAGHREDLRFYALLETLRSGTPPFRVATYYLESGHLDCEDVDEAVLDAALRRVIDAVGAIVSIRHGGREPTTTPGPRCRWCPLAHTCPDVWTGHDDEDPGGI